MRQSSPSPIRVPDEDDFLSCVLAGLRQRPRTIPPKFFYDARGSELFDLICTTPEYYPTRTETAILNQYGAEMAALIGPSCVFIELGSGSASKTPLLLRHLSDDAVYLPIDICGPYLMQSTRRLQTMFPALRMHPLCADYTRLPRLDLDRYRGLRKSIFFPGSTIGNCTPDEAVLLLQHAGRLAGSHGAILIGVDNKKPSDLLNAAYNDASGHTAAFNRNLLVRMQRELGARLDPDGFTHHARYNEGQGRIEMHLVSRRVQAVRIRDESFSFEAGESIHTENSYKYTAREFRDLASKAGWRAGMTWTDRNGWFNVHLLTRS